jgi:hypothetical protein
MVLLCYSEMSILQKYDKIRDKRKLAAVKGLPKINFSSNVGDKQKAA